MTPPIYALQPPGADDRSAIELALVAQDVTGAPVVVLTVAGDTDVVLDDDSGLETRVLSGSSVPKAVHALAREERAGLIVVGSTRRGTLGQVLAGSTAQQVLHEAPCPVAVAPHGYKRGPVRSVACAFADTPEGHEALDAAALLARRADATLRVVTVLLPKGAMDSMRDPGFKPEKEHTMTGQDRSKLTEAAERAIAALPGPTNVELDVHVDDPAEILLRISEHADVLVCGSRGQAPRRAVVLGSVSRKLVNGAQCPVLVLARGVDRPLAELAE
jgi:nucleotide-binding universal stress UspA family protein